MTEHEYRSNPAISRSELWWFNKSPEYFKWRKEHPTEPTPALLFGQVAHKLLLEPDTFQDEFAVAPNVDRRTKAGKEEWEAFCMEAADKTVVSADVFYQAYQMILKARDIPLVMELLACEHEVPLFWTDSDTDVNCKCRLDAMLTDEEGRITIVDYKTASDASYKAFSRDVIAYGYHFQAAMYSEGVIQNGLCPRLIKGKPKKRWQKDPETGKRRYFTEIPEKVVRNGTEGEPIYPRFIFIVQEKTEPYSVNIFEIETDFIVYGYDLFREYLGTYRSCIDLDIWPGPMGVFNEPQILTLPHWINGRDE